MKQVNSKIKKDRSREMTEIFNNYRNTNFKMGKIERVWISEKENVKSVNFLTGHTKDYTKVVIPFEEELIGKCVMLKIN